jgi:hypothetical protein
MNRGRFSKFRQNRYTSADVHAAPAAELPPRIGAAVGDDAGATLGRVAVRPVDPECLIDVAVTCCAAIQERGTGQRGRAGGSRTTTHGVRGQRTTGDHRHPSLHTSDVHIPHPAFRRSPIPLIQESPRIDAPLDCTFHVRPPLPCRPMCRASPVANANTDAVASTWEHDAYHSARMDGLKG